MFARSLKAGIAVLVLVLSAFVIAACGDDSSSGGGGEGKTGGTIKIGHTSMPDYLDPALSFTVDGWQALLQAYPGLLVFPHKSGPDGAEPVPGPGRGHARDLGGRQDLHAASCART